MRQTAGILGFQEQLPDNGTCSIIGEGLEPRFCWIKNPTAIIPVWLEKPERIAALAMLIVVGLLV